MFSIVGIAKIKTRAALARRASHHLRCHDVPNADPARLHQNACAWNGSHEDLAAAFFAVTSPLAKRKDAVHCIEVMLTTSPEWFEDDPKNIKASRLTFEAKNWLQETFGASNVFAMGLHRDEKTPHLWAFVTPIHEGRLVAKHFLGTPQKMRSFHDSWALKMAPFGLSRGAVKSGARHIDVKTYYSAVNGHAAAQESISREMSRRALNAAARLADLEARADELSFYIDRHDPAPMSHSIRS